MKKRAPSTPPPDEPVITSSLVFSDGMPITRIIRDFEHWLYLSGMEEDDTEPIVMHYAHIVEHDESIASIALRRGEYAIRGRSYKGLLGGWERHGPYSKRRLDQIIRVGIIADQENKMSRYL